MIDKIKMMQIFLARDGVQAGPYSLDELNSMLASGQVRLTDLAWHAGMDAWQPLDVLTQGQAHYVPSAEHLALSQQLAATVSAQNSTQASSQDADKPDIRLDDTHLDASAANQSTGERRRVTVAELYGRAPTAAERAAQAQAERQAERARPADALEEKPQWMGRHHSSHQAAESQTVSVVYASMVSRFLAFCINMLLLMASVMPLQMALINSGIDLEQFRAQNLSDAMANSQALSQQMLAHIPASSVTLTFMLLFALVVVQLIMIAKRGQSIGKLVTGIRVVSESTGKVPDVAMGVGMRTVALYVIYQLAISMLNIFTLGLLMINYVMASSHPKKQGWHDRLAKTVVVKAHPSQLNKA